MQRIRFPFVLDDRIQRITCVRCRESSKPADVCTGQYIPRPRYSLPSPAGLTRGQAPDIESRGVLALEFIRRVRERHIRSRRTELGSDIKISFDRAATVR